MFEHESGIRIDVSVLVGISENGGLDHVIDLSTTTTSSRELSISIGGALRVIRVFRNDMPTSGLTTASAASVAAGGNDDDDAGMSTVG